MHTFGDAHLYANHVDHADRLLGREPRPLPRMRLDPAVREVGDFRSEHLSDERSGLDYTFVVYDR